MLSLLSQPQSLLYAVTALVGLLTVVVLAVRAPAVFIGLFLVLDVLANSRLLVSLVLSVSGINVGALDVLAAVALTVGLVRLLQQPRTPAAPAIWILVGLLAITWMRGLAEFGLQPSVNGARGELYLVSGLVYAVTAARPPRRSQALALVLAGAVGMAVAWLGFALGGIRSATSAIVVNGEVITGRPIFSSSALLVLVASIIGFYLIRPRGWRVAWLASGLLTVLLLQHRSVWVAALAALAVWGLLAAIQRGHRGVGAAAVALPFLVLLAVALVLAARTNSALATSATSTGTWTWRLQNWTSTLSFFQARPVADWVTGLPAGTDLVRFVDGHVVHSISSHSLYLDSLRFAGLIGVLAWLTVALAAGRRGRLPLNAMGLDAVLAWPLVTLLLVYGVTYEWPNWVGFLLGVMLATPIATRSSTPAGPGGTPTKSSLPVRSAP